MSFNISNCIVNEENSIEDNNEFCKFDKEIFNSFYHTENLKKTFFIIHQNIRSIRKNFDLFLTHLESFINKPDLIFYLKYEFLTLNLIFIAYLDINSILRVIIHMRQVELLFL